MVRIRNKELPENKNVYVALSRVYGIGKKYKKNSRSRKILEKLNINPLLKVKDLNFEQLSKIVSFIGLISQETNFKLEGDLKQEKEQNIEKLKAIRCRKGKLHDKNKKVRGQRTHSNNRTRPKGIESTTVRAVAIAGKKAPKQQG